MKRRDFISRAACATGAVAAGSSLAAATSRAASPGAATSAAGSAASFTMNFAPHFGMFANSAGDDVVDQLRFMAEQGFRSLEDNGMKDRSVEEQGRIAEEMSRLGMTMGVFVAH